MCGIWGISIIDRAITKNVLAEIAKKLMILSETRGKDASGIAVMQEGDLCVLRKAKSSHELLRDDDFLKYLKVNILNSKSKNIWIMGHSRLVTNGTQYHPNNNQPVAKHNMALVHNGIIVNEGELWNKIPDVVRESELDSEVILETFRYNLNKSGDVRKATNETYRSLKGMAATIMFTQDGHHMVAASNNGSLYECHSVDRNIRLFASESLMLEKVIREIPELKKRISIGSITQLSRGKSVDVCLIQMNYILKK